MLVVLGDGDLYLRDLVLLVAVDDTEVPGSGQVVAAVAAALREPVALIVGVIGPRQMRPRRPGLLAPCPGRPRRFSGSGGLPGSPSREGGFDEFPEFRDSRCSNLANRAASVSLASISSEICTACALIRTA